MNNVFDMALADNGWSILFTQASPIHGQGLFTTGDLPPATIICRRLGLRESLSPRDMRAIIGIDGVDPGSSDDIIFKSINHSCHPNSQFTDTGCLINSEKIPEGEEITIDYCSMLTGSDWQSPCFCGRPDCRRIIKALR